MRRGAGLAPRGATIAAIGAATVVALAALGAAPHAVAQRADVVTGAPVATGARPPYTPWTDATGADHLKRDAERRAREGVSSPARPPGDGLADAPARAGTGSTAPGTLDPAEAEALRRRGERERDARRLRGGMSPQPEPTPRIQPDAPPAPPPVAVPRIEIPKPGEPGGAPIPLPTCGPAGCFDANGRALPSAGGGVLTDPAGQPCVRIGNAASC